MEDGQIRVLIVDDHLVFSQALQTVLSTKERISVVGLAADGSSARKSLVSLKPDLIILDYGFPDEEGMSIANSLRYMQRTDSENGSVKPELRVSTYEGYSAIVRVHLIPRFGHIKLNKLTTEYINRVWARMIDEGYSAVLIDHCHNRLSKALNDATKRKLIAINPMSFVAKPRIEPKEMQILDTPDIENLLVGAEGTEYYSIVHTALHTGMRRNELLGLRWKDVDVTEAMVYLSRSVYRGRGGKTLTQSPKTKAGRRSIPLTPSSALHLKEQRDRQRLDGILYGYDVNENTPVFVRRTGKPLLPDAITHGFKRIVRSLGLYSVRFHDLRHTHASILLKQGVHPKVVQERLGHAKISTTLDIYSHVMPGLQKEAVERFDLALGVRK